jgi:hypothetical protein
MGNIFMSDSFISTCGAAQLWAGHRATCLLLVKRLTGASLATATIIHWKNQPSFDVEQVKRAST